MLSGRGGQWATSRELIEEAVRHEPENAALHCDLGVIYGNMGLAGEAIAEFRTALRLEPDDPVSLFDLGIMYRTTGDAARARELYERLKTADPAMAERMKSAQDVPLISPPASER